MQLIARIRGRVQGVFYRAWARETALRLGLKGRIRNLPDGNVECVAQGDREALLRLEGLLWQGPPTAQVEAVESEWRDQDQDFAEFRIEH